MAGHEKHGSERDRTRLRRKVTIRKRVHGTAERPRLTVFRSSKHIYAQVIDDLKGSTVAAASSLEKDMRSKTGANVEAAKAVGKLVAQRAIEKGVKYVGEYIFRKEGKKK